jgi:hypothetical protein
MGVGRGVGYVTKSRRISWTFGYRPQQRPGTRFHMMREGRVLVISPRIEEIVDMWLHLITDSFLLFHIMGVGRGVGYFTKSRRISWTFGYTPQRKPGIRLHTMHVGRGVGYFTKDRRNRGHVATHGN